MFYLHRHIERHPRDSMRSGLLLTATEINQMCWRPRPPAGCARVTSLAQTCETRPLPMTIPDRHSRGPSSSSYLVPREQRCTWITVTPCAARAERVIRSRTRRGSAERAIGLSGLWCLASLARALSAVADVDADPTRSNPPQKTLEYGSSRRRSAFSGPAILARPTHQKPQRAEVVCTGCTRGERRVCLGGGCPTPGRRYPTGRSPPAT